MKKLIATLALLIAGCSSTTAVQQAEVATDGAAYGMALESCFTTAMDAYGKGADVVAINVDYNICVGQANTAFGKAP